MKRPNFGSKTGSRSLSKNRICEGILTKTGEMSFYIKQLTVNIHVLTQVRSIFVGFSFKKGGLLIFWWSENLLECSDRPHIVPTCSTHQFYRLREFQGDRSTLPDKKVDFLILGEDISLILVIEIPSKLEGVPGFSDFPKNLQL